MAGDDVTAILADAAAEAGSARTAVLMSDLLRRGGVLDVEAAAAAAAEGARHGAATAPALRRADLEVATAAAASAAAVANAMLAAARSPPRAELAPGTVAVETVVACAAAAAGAAVAVYVSMNDCATWSSEGRADRVGEDVADQVAIASAAAAAAVDARVGSIRDTSSASVSVFSHFVLTLSIGVAALAAFAVMFTAV